MNLWQTTSMNPRKAATKRIVRIRLSQIGRSQTTANTPKVAGLVRSATTVAALPSRRHSWARPSRGAAVGGPCVSGEVAIALLRLLPWVRLSRLPARESENPVGGDGAHRLVVARGDRRRAAVAERHLASAARALAQHAQAIGHGRGVPDVAAGEAADARLGGHPEQHGPSRGLTCIESGSTDAGSVIAVLRRLVPPALVLAAIGV